MNIIDGRSMFGLTLEKFLHSKDWTKVAQRRGIVAPSIVDVNIDNDETKYTKVRINRGKLIADCPNCNGAEFVWIKGPYLMICANCGNSDIGGKYRQILRPSLEYLNNIIAVLLLRTNPENQNWTQDETLEDLVEENKKYGIGVGV